METQEFTDYQRKQIADKGYASVGTVVKVVRGRDNVKGDDPDGLDAVAVKDEKNEDYPHNFSGLEGPEGLER